MYRSLYYLCTFLQTYLHVLTFTPTCVHHNIWCAHTLYTSYSQQVEIEVNGTPIELKMTLDESGSAFFVKSKSEEVSTHH